jgi:peroxiredoxin family protein
LKSAHGDKFKIYACPLAAQLCGVKKEDLVELVDDIRGPSTSSRRSTEA